VGSNGGMLDSLGIPEVAGKNGFRFASRSFPSIITPINQSIYSNAPISLRIPSQP
jgi:hypothetical protein